MIYFYIGKLDQNNIHLRPWSRVYKIRDHIYWTTPEGFMNSGYIIPDELIAEIPEEMKEASMEEIKLYINL